tara:strand:- start:241 stop:594 length:354 start_codon:yes stop_codon:yes gene_type:complete
MTTKTIERAVHSVQRGVIIYNVKKTGGGTPALGGADSLQFSVTDNGVGDYSLSLLDEASEESLVVYLQSKTAGVICKLGTVSSSSIQVECFSDLAETTPAEGDFDALVVKRKRSDKF